ncbi:MAG TPA: hypothetical protein VM141_11935 [Planctomycetota bacterium]|nr:hypothetical protein [Planctomycetota bacterium]
MIRPDRPFHSASGRNPSQERLSLTRKQNNRRELGQFFAECIQFLEVKAACHGQTADPLSEGIAAFAFDRFGALASNVLRHWGINSPDELENCFYEYLRACGSRGTRRTAGFSQSEALKALFRGDYWP